MWKVFSLVIFVCAFSDALCGSLELKGTARLQLERSIEHECSKYIEGDHKNLVISALMGAVGCLMENLGKSKVVENLQNATESEHLYAAVKEFCDYRKELLECGHQLIEYLTPCTPESVQTQIGPMKVGVTQLFAYICDDNLAKLRTVINDGGYDCFEKKNSDISNCYTNRTNYIIEFPEDVTSFSATETCHKFDNSVMCTLKVADECPEPSLKEYMENIFQLIRSGTYCHVTVPLNQNQV